MSATSSPAVVPRYLAVKNHLREGIAASRWVPGDLLPSEAELTQQFGISRMTANRALKELEQDGLVERIQGVGTFVAQLHRVASTLVVRDIHEEIVGRGHQHSARLHRLETVSATVGTAAVFGIAPGAPLFHSIMVHLENGVPIQCEDRLVNPDCAPGYLEVDFLTLTPTHYLLDIAPLSEARYTIQAVLPSALDARLLGVARGAACLQIDRLTFSRGVAVTQVRLLHPGTRYVLHGSFQP